MLCTVRGRQDLYLRGIFSAGRLCSQQAHRIVRDVVVGSSGEETNRRRLIVKHDNIYVESARGEIYI